MTGLPSIATRRAVPRLVNPPVFILGAPRSGTSLLYKILCLHPDVAWISNWNRLAPSIPELGALSRVSRHLPARRRAVWFGADSNAYVYGHRRPLADRLFPMPVEGEPVFVHCGLAEEVRSFDEIAATSVNGLRRTFDRLQRSCGGSTVVSKRIANNHRVPALLAAFPDARFIHLVRDGRVVAPSLRKVDWWPNCVVRWYGDTPTAWEESGRDPWEVAAREWVEELRAIERGLELVSSHQVLTVHYETIMSQPVDSLDEIASFAGLTLAPEWHAELAALELSVRSDVANGCPAPDALARVEQWQRPLLQQYGYVV